MILSEEFPLWINVLLVLGIIELAIIFIACLVFIYLYKPFSIAKHGRAGRHLLSFTYCVLALTGLSLFHTLIPVPLGVSIIAQVVILGGLVFATVDRVYLYLYSERLMENEGGDTYDDRTGSKR